MTTYWNFGVSGNWDIAANWSGGVPNAAEDAFITAPGAGGPYTVTSNGADTADSLTIDSADVTFKQTAAGTLTIGAVFELDAGTAILDGVNTIGGGVLVKGGTLFAGNAGALGSQTVSLAGSPYFVSAEVVATFSGTVANALSFAGNVDFAAAHGQTVTMGSGGVTLGADGSYGAVCFGDSMNDGTIVYDSSGGVSDNNGTNTYYVDVLGGTLMAGDSGFDALTDGSHIITYIFQNATLDLAGFDATITNLGGYGTLADSGGVTITLDAASFSGQITGDTAVDIDGNVYLYGINTYTGGTTIETGASLYIALGSGATVKGAIVNNGALTATAYDPVTFANIISGSGAVTYYDGEITVDRAQHYSGGTTIGYDSLEFNAGTLSIDRASALGSGLLTLTGGELLTTKSMTIRNEISIEDGAAIEAAHGTTLTIKAASFTQTDPLGPGSLIRLGDPTNDGTLVLGAEPANGTGGYTLELAGGIVRNGEYGLLPYLTGTAAETLVDTGATLDVGKTGATVVNLQGAGLVTGAAAFTISGGNFAGVISGKSGITFDSSAMVLTGNNTYTGGTTINGIALALGDGGSSGSVRGAIVNNGGILTIDHSNAFALTNVISDTGSLYLIGKGTTTIDHANTYSGETDVANGVLSIDRASALGTGNVILEGGVLLATANLSLTHGLTFQYNGDLAAAHGVTLTEKAASLIYSADTITFGAPGDDGTIVWEDPGSPSALISNPSVEVAAGTLKEEHGTELDKLLYAATATTIDSGATIDWGTSNGDIFNLHGSGTITGEMHGRNAYIYGGNFAGKIDGAIGVGIEGNVTLSGGGNFQGGLNIDSGYRLDLLGHAHANVTLNSSTVALHDTADFTGKIEGFAVGDTVDLTAIHFGGGTSRTYDKSTHTLTVTDGTDTADVVFDGHYARANFVLADDGSGGTDVTFVAVPHEASDWPLAG